MKFAIILFFGLIIGGQSQAFTMTCSVKDFNDNKMVGIAETLKATCGGSRYLLSYKGRGLGLRIAKWEGLVFSCPRKKNPLGRYAVAKVTTGGLVGCSAGVCVKFKDQNNKLDLWACALVGVSPVHLIASASGGILEITEL